jgi:hypothetical protein
MGPVELRRKTFSIHLQLTESQFLTKDEGVARFCVRLKKGRSIEGFLFLNTGFKKKETFR